MKRSISSAMEFLVVYLGSLAMLLTVALLTAGCSDTEPLDTAAQTAQSAKLERERVGR